MVQLKNKVFWDYFLATGNIGAYLIFCELKQKKYKFLRRKINS
ncbi:MAG: hypothetical protein ACOYED_02850 [Peptococcia bacterium]|jgi:hypothetical protein